MSRVVIIKVLVFVALLVVLFTLEGFVPPPGAFSLSRHSPPWLLFTALYVYGASLAVWGNKTIGMLHPTSYRWLYITDGVFLIILILSLVLYGRGHVSRLPKPGAANPAIAPGFQVVSSSREVADPGR